MRTHVGNSPSLFLSLSLHNVWEIEHNYTEYALEERERDKERVSEREVEKKIYQDDVAMNKLCALVRLRVMCKYLTHVNSCEKVA